MSDDRLKTLLAGDAPPARDLGFELAVMARIERQRFRRGMAMNIALAAAAALLLWLAAPPLEGFWRQEMASHVSDLVLAALLMTATYLGLRHYVARD